jgi:hypothetical protein
MRDAVTRVLFHSFRMAGALALLSATAIAQRVAGDTDAGFRVAAMTYLVAPLLFASNAWRRSTRAPEVRSIVR